MNEKQRKLIVTGLIVVVVLFIMGTFLSNQALGNVGSGMFDGYNARKRSESITASFMKFIFGVVVAVGVFVYYTGKRKFMDDVDKVKNIIDEKSTKEKSNSNGTDSKIVLKEKLDKLKELYDEGILEEQEYKTKRQSLIDQYKF